MTFDLSPSAPIAPQHPLRLTKHRHVRNDPFYWLRNTKGPEVIGYLKAENDYADAVLAPTKPLQDALYAEMLSRIEETDLSVPVKFGDWMYYSRTEQSAQYPIHVRKRIRTEGWETSPEELLLDENKEAAGKAFYEVGDYEVSPSGRFLAWTEDTKGQREYRLRVRDLLTGKDLRLATKGVVSLAWAEDDQTLLYVTEDPGTKRANRLWRRQIRGGAAVALYEERDERFNLLIFKTRSREYLVLNSSSYTTSEARILPAHKPEGRWRLVKKRRAGIEYEVDHHSDKLFLRINDTGANFRLVCAPVENWQPANWCEYLPQRDDVVLEGIDLYRDWLIATERRDGVPQLSITSLITKETHQVAFDDPAYVVDLEDLPEWDSPILRYTYESLTTPDSLFDYDPVSRRATLLKRQPIKGDFDPANYASERLYATAEDGTRIPVSVVYHKDLPRDGRAPLWLDGYGAYGLTSDPWFSASRLSLLDRGCVFAIAHVRGGGDLGQRWYEGGKLENKRNTFADFIACAEMLIARRYTGKGRILAQGGSAGGLLVGAVLNMRPELFGAAILEVPFVDVVTTMLDPSLPLTVGEFEEWGNPAQRADYFRMLAYSPYDNLAPGDYPPILIEAGLHDTQVMIWEPAKYVAKLRTLKTNTTPLLLATSMDSGHGGASGRYDALRERARQMAFGLTAIAPVHDLSRKTQTERAGFQE